MAAGMHKARALGAETAGGREMIGGIGFSDQHAVHVAAESRHGTGAAGFKHRNSARVAARFINKTLRNAGSQRTLDGGFNQLGVTAHHRFGIDDLSAEQHLKP